MARAPALHAGGHRFDSDILHKIKFFKKKIGRYNGLISSSILGVSTTLLRAGVVHKLVTTDG